MLVSDDKVVYIHYTLTDDEGEIIDSSEGHAPLGYIHGTGNIIAGLENALLGRSIGDRFNISIPPEEAYGIWDEGLIQAVSREAFHGVDEIVPGMQFQAESPGGSQLVTVLEVRDDMVLLDGNHPMSGKTLHFDVQVAEVRDATEEELSHGHIHGPGGHHH